MLTRLYVNNFRSLVNFDLTFEPCSFFLGPNGAGKSSIFDILDRLRAFITGLADVAECFPPQEFTRWILAKPGVQTYHIDIKNELGSFHYHLAIEHNYPEKRRIQKEQLTLDGQPLFHFDLRQDDAYAQLYNDTGPGPRYPMDWFRSGVGALMERRDNQKLTGFKNSLNNLTIVGLIPQNMTAFSKEEVRYPRLDMSNFVDWYRYLSSIDQDIIFKIKEALLDALPGFRSFAFEPYGEVKKLAVKMDTGEGKTISYDISELSDGQRALIVLYTLLVCTPAGGTLCLDEPENYLALPEIQPWLNKLHDRVENEGLQALIVSHHPVLINLLARSGAFWLNREGGNSPTRIQPISPEEDPSGLSPSSLVERGWIFDE